MAGIRCRRGIHIPSMQGGMIRLPRTGPCTCFEEKCKKENYIFRKKSGLSKDQILLRPHTVFVFFQSRRESSSFGWSMMAKG